MLYEKLKKENLLEYLEIAQEIQDSFNFYLATGFEDLIVDIIKIIKQNYEKNKSK